MSLWQEEEDEAIDDSYYEREVIPKIEKQRLKDLARCEHHQFYVVCSTCKHVIASEKNDPYGALEAHRKAHETSNFIHKQVL